MRDGTIPHGPALLADERVTVVVADVAVALAEAAPASYDLVLLDVDNGPGYLVHDANAALYRAPFLETARAALRPGGVLVDLVGGRGARPARRRCATVFGVAPRRRRTTCCCRTATRSTGSTSRGYRRTHMSDDDVRIEHDSMGEVRVPRDALWQAQTQRAVENFPISGTPIEPALIHAIGRVKAAAATVNAELGVLDEARAAAIVDGRRGRSSPASTTASSRSTSSRPGPAPAPTSIDEGLLEREPPQPEEPQRPGSHV